MLQMLDMIHPVTPGKISLNDLKKCKMTSIFFDTFFNLEKYLDHEQRDPFASTRDHDADGHEVHINFTHFLKYLFRKKHFLNSTYSIYLRGSVTKSRIAESDRDFLILKTNLTLESPAC